MPYRPDIEIDLIHRVGFSYIIHSHHRRVKGNPHKCYWTINNSEEVNCFINSISRNWSDDAEAWGLEYSNGNLKVLGMNVDKKELKLAKFILNTGRRLWHGYPADYMVKAQDRPSTTVLKDWVMQGYISKSKMNKIRAGQTCNL